LQSECCLLEKNLDWLMERSLKMISFTKIQPAFLSF